jgi:hypothetical protein
LIINAFLSNMSTKKGRRTKIRRKGKKERNRKRKGSKG